MKCLILIKNIKSCLKGINIFDESADCGGTKDVSIPCPVPEKILVKSIKFAYNVLDNLIMKVI